MKINTESTTLERLRMFIGSLLAFAGVVTLVIIGAFYGYTNGLVWIVGLLLCGNRCFNCKEYSLDTVFTRYH